MIDILYLAHNRLKFTEATFAALVANTDWSLVLSLHVYDDNSTDGTREWLARQVESLPDIGNLQLHCGVWASPVAVMNDFITTVRPELFAKVDNDTMVPPGWLGECLTLLEQNPTVDLLGIEAMYPVQAKAARRYAEPAQYIGGIGVMRGEAFKYGLPRPDGRFGFTAWQDHEERVTKAWINPALPVCLLDRVPFEPWASLSADYVAKGWQRPWEPYRTDCHKLWEWWRR